MEWLSYENYLKKAFKCDRYGKFEGLVDADFIKNGKLDEIKALFVLATYIIKEQNNDDKKAHEDGEEVLTQLIKAENKEQLFKVIERIKM